VADVHSEPASELVELERDDCLRLLAATKIGRVAVNVPDWPPVIRPVTYVFDASSASVVFRSAEGAKFTALLMAGRAAFEVDGIDPATETGWSVIIIGVAEQVTNTAEIHRLESLGLRPWAAGDKPHWIRLRANVVSGRRITAHSQLLAE
jgi:nitroimidazol reductase NimA-like FMN-containing flavoprotein (pyridoxamine 5'-phosphate oxidase superfamily)